MTTYHLCIFVILPAYVMSALPYGQVFTADIMYYSGTSVTSACGPTINPSTDKVIGVSKSWYTTTPTTSDPICNNVCIIVSYNGNSITVPVREKCDGCTTSQLLLSLAAFQALADTSNGYRTGATWQFVSCSQNSSATTTTATVTTTKVGATTAKPATTTQGSSSGSYTFTYLSNSATGQTTRYWDCCKVSCGWSGKASVTAPVQSCAKDGVTSADVNAQSGCNGGPAYACNSNQPWAINSTLSFGFAAAALVGQNENSWCCACYELKFTSGSVSGKTMVVQVTNTGGDLGANHFDVQIPGGGVGIFNGCSGQWSAPSDGWGSRYGGVSSRSDCAQLPSQLQAGCQWRFDWFQNADNPAMNLRRVKCPVDLTSKTGCKRNDE